VLYLSDDRIIVERLVKLLRERWSVWWDQDIVHGDWGAMLREELPQCDCVVPVLSDTVKGERKAILKDEMRLAMLHSKPIIPFIIGAAEVPIGFGDLNHTEAFGWRGDPKQPGYQQLVSKIATVVDGSSGSDLRRPNEASIGGKPIRMPSFIFSVSSFETRLQPIDGLSLLAGLQPGAALVSAYDVWKCDGVKQRRTFDRGFRRLCESSTVVVLDSGNYEASRKLDYYSAKSNPSGWRREHYLDTVTRCAPDLAFHFDKVDPNGRATVVAKQIITDYTSDERALRGTGIALCPIVHVPASERASQSRAAAAIVREVAEALDPPLIAIPERELGEGLRQRFATTKMIRNALNTLGRYYPLHLLGTGNPLSMAALAVAGADLFDGLEWCRTVADYRNGFLFHFQQFDIVGEACLGHVRDEQIRAIASNRDVPYATRALAYNIDFFEDWARTMRDLIHSGQQESLLKVIPDAGLALYEQLRTRGNGTDT